MWRVCGVSWEQTDDPEDFAETGREGEWPQQDPGWNTQDPGWNTPGQAWNGQDPGSDGQDQVWDGQSPESDGQDPGWDAPDSGWPAARGYRVAPAPDFNAPADPNARPDFSAHDFSAASAAWATGGGGGGVGTAPELSGLLGAPTMADAAPPELVRDAAPSSAYVSQAGEQPGYVSHAEDQFGRTGEQPGYVTHAEDQFGHAGEQPDYAGHAGYAAARQASVSHGADEPWVIRQTATTRRRTSPLRMLRIVIPIVVIAAVGIGAVMMLTGRTTVALDGHTKKPQAAQRPMPRHMKSTSTPMMEMASFPAPGALPGTTVVQALASHGSTQIAAGTAGGLAAIWKRTTPMQRAAHAPWTLVFRSRTLTGQLTSVTYGDHGWIAAGGSAHHPLVLTSSDGRNWKLVSYEHSFRFGGEHVFGAAAGSAGYVVVGLITHRGRMVAADWWSTNLVYWQRGGNGGLDGRLASSQMRATVATTGGFVAVGQHGRKPATWMEGSAHDWMLMDLPMPAGASSAVMTQAAASGERVVAIGDAVTSHGLVPFAAVTPDGGATWTESSLIPPGRHTTVVTALTYTGTSFVAAGESQNKAVYWTSASGTNWSAPKAAGNGITVLTGLAPGGNQITGVGVMMDRPTVWDVRG